MSVIFDETNKTAKLEYGAEEINTKLGQINDLEAKKHTHSNQTVIDKLSEVDGQLKYDGNAISGGTSLTEEQITNIGKVSTIESNVSNLETTVGNKVDKVEGKTLTSNDFTNDYKTKLDSLQNYTLPTATTDVLGGVKVDGTSMTVDSDGTIHSTANISDETFNTKINEYLTTNPPSAMTDEQVATSVNKGIADDSINVVAGIKDGSVTKAMLSDDLFAKTYRVKSSSQWCTFNLNFSSNLSIKANDKLKIQFKIKSLIDLTDDIIVRLNTNTTDKIVLSNIAKTLKANELYEYSYEKEFTSANTITGISGNIANGSSKEINAEIYNVKVIVNEEEISGINYTVSVSDKTENAIANIEVNKSSSFANNDFVLNNILDIKKYSDAKLNEAIENIANSGIYPFDKTAILPDGLKNGAILNLELYNVPTNVLSEGIYIQRLTTWWMDLYYGDKKPFVTGINVNDSYISQTNNIATYDLKLNNGCRMKLTLDKSKIKAGASTFCTKQQTLLSKECVKSVKPSEKTTLPFANTIYVTQGSSRPHAVPIFLDYLYDGRANKILFENGDDRYYIRSAVGSPNGQDTNIINTKKTLKLKSDTLDVNPLKFNVVSIEEKTKTEPIKVLTIGDSVTEGAITDKQYWAFANEFFALEDLDRNRTTDVMFLGNCNRRETTVTKGEKSKTVKSYANGISSWSLNHWMTNEYSPFVYYEDSDTEKKNPIFSIQKWIERYRTHTDDGVALNIGDEGIGTKITEDNISKIQCCTPNVIYINSTHNDYGEVLENTKTIIEKIRAELPDVKIIVASPMGITGTWHKDKYINKDWIDSSEITGPNYNWGGQYGQARLQLLDYLTEQEKLNDWLYIMPQMLIQPTVEGLSYEEVDCGVKTMKRPNKINQLASIHPSTITHKIWGYEMYCLLKYIFRSSDTTTNEVTVALDNTTLSIAKDGTSQLTATPSTTGTTVTFSSSDETVATVDSTGLVTAVGAGTAYIYAETSTSILPAVCTVEVPFPKLTLDEHNTLMATSSNWKQGEYGINNGKFTTGDGTRIAYNGAIKVDASTSYTLTTNNTSTKFVVRGLKSDGSLDTSFGAVDNGSSITTTSTTDTLVMTIYATDGGKTSSDLIQMIADGTIVPTITKVTE